MNTTEASGSSATASSNSMPIFGTPTSQPDVARLLGQFRRCSPWNGTGWNRVSSAEAIRLCHWDGQSLDCKKHGSGTQAAFPFEGASDQRTYDADDTVNQNVAELVESFWRAWLSPKAGLSTETNYAVKLAEWLIHTHLADRLPTEIELAAQYRETLGWFALAPRWQTEIALEYQTVRLDDLVKAALALLQVLQHPQHQAQVLQAYPGVEGLIELPDLILDPEREAEAAEYLQMAWETYSRSRARRDLQLPQLQTATLRHAVRALRTTGEAEMPVPTICFDGPTLSALKPYRDVFVPGEASDDAQCCAAIFQVESVTEIELRSREITRGYDPGWIAEACKHKGKGSWWGDASPGARMTSTAAPETLAEAMSAGGTYQVVDNGSELIQVVHAVYRMLDANKIPGVYCTVLHPSVGASDSGTGSSRASSYAWHGLLKDVRGRVPYVFGKRENVDRALVTSRGVPEILNSPQRMMKATTDAAIDQTSLAVNPPRHLYGVMETQYTFGPGAENMVTQGREPKYAEIPMNGVPWAYQLMTMMEKRRAQYFGHAHPELIPGSGAPKVQMRISGFLRTLVQGVQWLLDLSQYHMADEQFAEITGAPKGWLEANRRSYGTLSARLEFDARELDPEYVAQVLKAVNESIIPQDVNGVTNRVKWTRMQWQLVAPRLGRELVTEETEASKQMFDQVKEDIAQMFLGNAPEPVENDPAAKTKMDFAQRIIGANPNYKRALQDQEGRFAQLLQFYAKNLTQSVKQEENKMIGRIGVNPNEVNDNA